MPLVDIRDDFSRPDGPLGNGWIDLALEHGQWDDVRGLLVARPGIPLIGEDPSFPPPYRTQVGAARREIAVRPRILSPVRIAGGAASFQARATNLYFQFGAGARYGAHMQVGHFLAYRQLGTADNLEVGVSWLCPEFLSTIMQVSPIAFVDPLAADPTRLGLVPIYDVSLSSMFIQNAFRCPENQTFRIPMYRILGADGLLHRILPPFDENGPPANDGSSVSVAPPSYGPGVAHSVALRVKSGMIAMYFDGARKVGPLPVPAEMSGRDGWGMHVIAIQIDPTLGLEVGDVVPASHPNSGDTTPIDHDIPARIDSWYAKSFTGHWDAPFV